MNKARLNYSYVMIKVIEASKKISINVGNLQYQISERSETLNNAIKADI